MNVQYLGQNPTVRWTKLLWIDVLWQKNKTSKVTEIILRIEHARETCVTV